MISSAAVDILAFWRAAGRDRWFTKDAAFDADIRARFLDIYRAAAAGDLAAWQASDDGALALAITLDQFPRNLFRNDPRAFDTDAMARAVATRALDRGVDLRLEPLLRPFLYLPLMHSETLADQNRSVTLYQALGDAGQLAYAREHRDIIARFGRFPHRNAVLGRATTPDEQAYLAGGGFSG